MLLLHSSGNFLFSDLAVCLAVVCWITWEGTAVNSCMHKSVGFHIWRSKMDQMCVFVFALGQCVTGECTENKLPIIYFSAGLFKCLSASSRRLRRMLASGCCQFSVHVHLSWISSAEHGPQANIPLIFFHPWFISLASFLSNTWTPPPLLLCTEGWSVRRMSVSARAHLASSDWGEGDREAVVGGLVV